MKYYKIITRDYYGDRIASYADFIDDKEEEIFKKIGSGEILVDTDIFDNFFLSSYDKKEFWEWNLFDIHKGQFMYGKTSQDSSPKFYLVDIDPYIKRLRPGNKDGPLAEDFFKSSLKWFLASLS